MRLLSPSDYVVVLDAVNSSMKADENGVVRGVVGGKNAGGTNQSLVKVRHR
jgi:hypothetical protein